MNKLLYRDEEPMVRIPEMARANGPWTPISYIKQILYALTSATAKIPFFYNLN